MKVNIGWRVGGLAHLHQCTGNQFCTLLLLSEFSCGPYIGPLCQSELMGQGGGQSSPYARTSNKSMQRLGDGGGSCCHCCCCCYILSASIASYYNTYIHVYMSARKSESTYLHLGTACESGYKRELHNASMLMFFMPWRDLQYLKKWALTLWHLMST